VSAGYGGVLALVLGVCMGWYYVILVFGVHACTDTPPSCITFGCGCWPNRLITCGFYNLRIWPCIWTYSIPYLPANKAGATTASPSDNESEVPRTNRRKTAGRGNELLGTSTPLLFIDAVGDLDGGVEIHNTKSRKSLRFLVTLLRVPASEKRLPCTFPKNN